MLSLKEIALLALFSVLCSCQEASNSVCNDLKSELLTLKDSKFDDPSSLTARYIDVEFGSDIEECLNYNATSNPPPCRTIHYALVGENPLTHSNNNTIFQLGPGTHNLTMDTAIVGSSQVAMVGEGAGVTFLTCGGFNGSDSVCSFLNLQIRTSRFVYLSGLTFTLCGPVTSDLYIAFSDNIFIEDCVFKDNLSPPVLIHNSPTIVFNNVTFTDNHPERLKGQIIHNNCYSSGGREVFFLDNRTTSGSISFYIQDWATRFLILDSKFYNNSARPDEDVSIARYSAAYGHGGAVNIRLLNSTDSRVCIMNTRFIKNFAEAHAGALAISLAGFSEANRFYISNTLFDGNFCHIEKCTGGAVGIDFLSNTQINRIIFTDTNFTRNRASSSGAIVLSTYVSAVYNEDGDSDVLRLDNCLFTENEAFFEGTAFGAFSLTNANQIGLPIEVNNCHFDDNIATRGSIDTTAVTAYRVLITFTGVNEFNDNYGGGLSLLSSRMDVRGNLTFNNNTAVFGGGIAMSGRSLILLYEGSALDLLNNRVSELGAGIYVEFASSDFVLSVLNTGCFIRYFSTQVGIQPSDWNTTVRFINNTAGLAGAAIYANDMSRCMWVGNLNLNNTIIFEIPANLSSPFMLENNTVESGEVVNKDLATDPSYLEAETRFQSRRVSYGERVSIALNSMDQVGNFRESVWSVNAPLEEQTLGSLSSADSSFVYDVASREKLEKVGGLEFVNETAEISVEFAFLQNQVVMYPVNLTIADCHPGYQLNNMTQECVCDDQSPQIIRCDIANRYFYVQDGIWVGYGDHDNSTLTYSNTIPGFLNCTLQGSLQGCLVKFDDPNAQCADGRVGRLCGDCLPEYGPTFDLRFCRKDCKEHYKGIVVFFAICFAVVICSLFVLYFDFPLPNELKGVIFFAQVVGVVYRNTPYLQRLAASPDVYDFFDFLINFLGFAMPFSVCLWPGIPAYGIALLGYIPPGLAILTAVIYILCANRFQFLGQREHYGFHGFYFLFLFVYKYILDTSFIFVNCFNVNGVYVFGYQGTVECFNVPFVFLFVLGGIVILALGIVLPLVVLYIIYKPQKMIQVSAAFIHGIKEQRRYLWYGVWDIWRRLLFVTANLFLALSTASTVLFIHTIISLVCLVVVCMVQPYKKYHINFMEAMIILSLLGVTLAILDSEDIYVGERVSAFFVIFPYLYGVLFIAYRGVRKIGNLTWNKGNKKWNLLERSSIRKVVERHNSIKDYIAGKKHQLTRAFAETEDEQFTQVHESSLRSARSSDSNSSNKSNERAPSAKTSFVETCNLREPLLDQ